MRFAFLLVLFISVFANGQRSVFSEIDFKKADSIAILYKGESLENLPVLTHKLTVGLPTQVEKFRSIYTWIATNIKNDYGAYLATRKKRKKLAENREAFLEWNTSFTPKVFENLITDRKTACTGYAYLMREMASLADLNCKIINGFGRTPTLLLNAQSTPNHSWNAIEINGKWYLCDATWSAGRIMLEENGPQFQSDYFDGYFLADPELFVKNHYPIEVEWTLLTRPPSFLDFREGPIIYKEAFIQNIIPISPKKIQIRALRNETILFRVRVPENYSSNTLGFIVDNGVNGKKVPSKSSCNLNECTLEYAFEKTGLYDVHIQADDMLVATYVVRVRKKHTR